MPDLAIGLVGSAQVQKVRVTTDSVVIGRAKEADLTVGHASLSREHFRIYEAGPAWFVEDLGSSNGTTLNEIALEGAEALRPGDVVRAGQVSVIVERLDMDEDSQTLSGSRREVVGGGRKTGRGVFMPRAPVETPSQPKPKPSRTERAGVAKPRKAAPSSDETGELEDPFANLDYDEDDLAETDRFTRMATNHDDD